MSRSGARHAPVAQSRVQHHEATEKELALTGEMDDAKPKSVIRIFTAPNVC
jgi:hypothetical protein